MSDLDRADPHRFPRLGQLCGFCRTGRMPVKMAACACGAQVASEGGAASGLWCSLGRRGRPGAGLESQGDLGIQGGGTLNDGRLRGMNAFLSLTFSSEISPVPLRTENQGCLFNYKRLHH